MENKIPDHEWPELPSSSDDDWETANNDDVSIDSPYYQWGRKKLERINKERE